MQPHLPDRVATLLGRHRLGGRRTRVLRRLLAIGLLIAAGAVASISPTSATEGTAVLVATRDLPAGARLTGADIAVAAVRSPPDGLLDAGHPGDVAGAVLSGSMRRGEILTDARIVGDRGPDPGPGRAAVPVPLTDAAVAALLAPGSHVVLVGVPAADDWSSAGGGAIEVLAADAVVLSVAEPAGGLGGVGAGRIAVISVPAAEADPVTAAAAAGAITVRFGS